MQRARPQDAAGLGQLADVVRQGGAMAADSAALAARAPAVGRSGPQRAVGRVVAHGDGQAQGGGVASGVGEGLLGNPGAGPAAVDGLCGIARAVEEAYGAAADGAVGETRAHHVALVNKLGHHVGCDGFRRSGQRQLVVDHRVGEAR